MKRVIAFIFLLGVCSLITFAVSCVKMRYDGLESVCFVTSQKPETANAQILPSGSEFYVTADASSAEKVCSQLKNVKGYVLHFNPGASLSKLKAQFFDFCDQPYQVENIVLYEGYTSAYNDFREIDGRRYNVQLAVTPSEIVVGFPTILTGF